MIVLFEEIDGQPRYVKGDDDSGTERNAQLAVRLIRGRRYLLKVRLYWRDRGTAGSRWAVLVDRHAIEEHLAALLGRRIHRPLAPLVVDIKVEPSPSISRGAGPCASGSPGLRYPTGAPSTVLSQRERARPAGG